MAKKISLKNELGKKNEKQSSSNNSSKTDVTIEGILKRGKLKDKMPSISYVNTYKVKNRGLPDVITIDLTELVQNYPNDSKLIEQLIVGANETLKPSCSSKTVRTCFGGIRCFIEFLNSERNLSNNCITNISDVNIIVAQSFSNYLLSVYPKDSRRRHWYSSIKRIVERLQELYPNDPSVGKGFIWPVGLGHRSNVIEGYHPKEMLELIDACIKDIEDIIEFHQKYRTIDCEIIEEQWNLENLMYYINGCWEKSVIRTLKQPLAKMNRILRGSKRAFGLVKELGFTNQDICDLYLHNGQELAMQGRSPKATSISDRPDNERAELQFGLALGTLKKHFPLFPYYCNLNESKALLNTNNRSKDSHEEYIHHMINIAVNASASKIKFMNGSLGKMSVYASMHFVLDTLYPFLLLVLINTGWNLESVLSISDDVDAHITPDLILPDNYVLIHGKKVRGSKREKPLSVTHRSSRKTKYGTYWLLKYVESIVTQYKESPYYRKGALWQYTVPEFVTDTMISTLGRDLHMYLSGTSSRFIKRHEFKCFSDTTISHPKIRSGYVTLRQALGSTERELSEDLGHINEETIIHYTSDNSSNMIQDLTIRKIQKQFISDLANFKVRIVESKSLQELHKNINNAKTESEMMKRLKKEADRLGLDEKTIIHLLDVGSQKYILACEDSNDPSWPGFESFVKEGSKCRYFNKCALCSQAVVFPEALPYIARRILDLEKLKVSLVSTEWIFKFGDEFDAWHQILNMWSNRNQVEAAWELARTGFVVLPQVMRGI